MKTFCLFGAALLLFACVAPPARAQVPPVTNAPLAKGDALLVRIDGLGGGLPEYREIVDSDGNIELPFIGLIPAEGKWPAAVAAQMAAAYSNAGISTSATVAISYVMHFPQPPARTNLVRIRDPRQPVPAQPELK